jgi:hypothetical protein
MDGAFEKRLQQPHLAKLSQMLVNKTGYWFRRATGRGATRRIMIIWACQHHTAIDAS